LKRLITHKRIYLVWRRTLEYLIEMAALDAAVTAALLTRPGKPANDATNDKIASRVQ